MAENLHEYKLYGKQVSLLPERDYQGRALAHTTKRLARDGSAARKLWGKSWVFNTHYSLNLSALKGEDSQATLRITTLTLAPEGSHRPHASDF
jgi:hypothetical protein